MTDRLEIRDLELTTRLGVPPEERAAPQTVLVTLGIGCSLSAVAKQDDPQAGIDYAALAADIRKLGKTERKTIERLAEDIAALVLRKTSALDVTVSVTKHPPIKDVRGVSATITRSRFNAAPPPGKRRLIA